MKKLAVLFLSLILLSTNQLFAYNLSINIDPPSIRSSAKPGQIITQKIIVQNTSEQPMNVKVYANDWSYNENLSKQFLKLGSTPYSLNQNLHLYLDELNIPAKSKREVFFDIKSPLNAEGGLYGVIFFEASPTLVNARSSVKIVTRIGSIIYHEIEGTQKYNFDIVLNQTIKENKKRLYYFEIKNIGNTHLDLNGSLIIMTENKDVIERIDLSSIKCLPRAKQTFVVESEKSLDLQNYLGLLTFNYGQDKTFSKEIILLKSR